MENHMIKKIVSVLGSMKTMATLMLIFAISIGVASIPDTDADIQKITVIVSRESETIMTVADYKVNR